MTSTDADLSDGVGNAAALRKVHVDLAELGNDLFGLVSLLWHEGPPVCSSHNIRVDHFKGVGQSSGARQMMGEGYANAYLMLYKGFAKGILMLYYCIINAWRRRIAC